MSIRQDIQKARRQIDELQQQLKRGSVNPVDVARLQRQIDKLNRKMEVIVKGQ